jgi:hypothetical protein
MRQDDVLLVRHAQLAVAVALGEVGHDAHLMGRGIPRRGPVLLQRHRTIE